MTDAARLGLILLGLYFLISGASGFLSQFLRGEPVEPAWVAISLFAYVVPGALLVAFNKNLAGWSFGKSGAAAASSSSALVAGGLAVVAAYLFLDGISECVGAAVALIGGRSPEDTQLGLALVANGTFGLGRGAARAVSGAALLLFARPIAERIARVPEL